MTYNCVELPTMMPSLNQENDINEIEKETLKDANSTTENSEFPYIESQEHYININNDTESHDTNRTEYVALKDVNSTSENEKIVPSSNEEKPYIESHEHSSSHDIDTEFNDKNPIKSEISKDANLTTENDKIVSSSNEEKPNIDNELYDTNQIKNETINDAIMIINNNKSIADENSTTENGKLPSIAPSSFGEKPNREFKELSNTVVNDTTFYNTTEKENEKILPLLDQSMSTQTNETVDTIIEPSNNIETGICESAIPIHNDKRSYQNNIVEENFVDDRYISSNWYKFYLHKRTANIVEEPIKPGYCGTQIPFHIENVEDSTVTNACGTLETEYGIARCIKPQHILKKNCNSFFIYQFQNISTHLHAATGLCLKETGLLLNKASLAFPEEYKYPYGDVEIEDITLDDLERVATIELEYSGGAESFVDWKFINIEKSFRKKLANHLNYPKVIVTETEKVSCRNTEEEKKMLNERLPASNANNADQKSHKDKRATGEEASEETVEIYNESHIIYVSPTPVEFSNDILKICILSRKDNIDREKLVKALQELNETSFLLNHSLNAVHIYPGLSEEMENFLSIAMNVKIIWKQYSILFITLAAIILLFIVIMIIGCCLSNNSEDDFRMDDTVKVIPIDNQYWRRGVSNPITDEEMLRTESFSLVVENDTLTFNSTLPVRDPDESDANSEETNKNLEALDNGLLFPYGFITELNDVVAATRV